MTGAETNDYGIADNMELPARKCRGSDMGIFEYSSLADSGQLTFTMKVFKSNIETDGMPSARGSVLRHAARPLDHRIRST